jgi:ADP-ribosyl-[dinitrogen reductase] hydrolase
MDTDRSAGVLLGGGLGDCAPGQWSDDTEMTSVIAQVAASP